MDTESCIVQLLAHPSFDSATASTPQGRRPPGHPSLHRSFPLPKCRPRLPQPQVGRPGWRVRPSAEALPRKPSQADPPSHSIFFGSGSQTSKTVPRSRSVRRRIPRRRLSSSLHPPLAMALFLLAPFVGPPMCISLFGKLSFSASPDGWMEWMNVEEGRSSAEREAKITRRNGKSSGIGVGKRWSLTVICHVCPRSALRPAVVASLFHLEATNMTANCSKRCLLVVPRAPPALDVQSASKPPWFNHVLSDVSR